MKKNTPDEAAQALLDAIDAYVQSTSGNPTPPQFSAMALWHMVRESHDLPVPAHAQMWR